MKNHNTYYIKQIDIHDYNFFYINKEQKENYIVGYVLMKGRRRIAIGGFFGRQKAYVAFVKLHDKVPPKFFFKEVRKKFHEMATSVDLPIYAVRDETIANSKNFLKKLGFEYYTTSYDKEEIYKLSI